MPKFVALRGGDACGDRLDVADCRERSERRLVLHKDRVGPGPDRPFALQWLGCGNGRGAGLLGRPVYQAIRLLFSDRAAVHRPASGRMHDPGVCAPSAGGPAGSAGAFRRIDARAIACVCAQCSVVHDRNSGPVWLFLTSVWGYLGVERAMSEGEDPQGACHRLRDASGAAWPLRSPQGCLLSDVIKKITGEIIISHARTILKDDLNEDLIKKEKCMENTHPIFYKNQLFMHYGDLMLFHENTFINHQRHKGKFEEQTKVLRNSIDKDMLNEIKGSTDTEIMFYLFLSIKNKLQQNLKLEEHDLIIRSLLTLNNLIEEVKLINRSNIIYACGDFVLIAKIKKGCDQTSLNSLDLFLNINENGFEINSINTYSNTVTVGDNIAILINHNKCIVKIFRL